MTTQRDECARLRAMPYWERRAELIRLARTPRFCDFCGDQLEQRPREQRSRFATRRFCSRACTAQSAQPIGTQASAAKRRAHDFPEAT